MNMDSGLTRGQALDLVDEQQAARRRRWRRIIIVSVLSAAAIIAALLFFGKDKNAGGGEGQKAKQAPSVTVVVPGRTTVDSVVSATGSLAARRELPVGIAGEGGLITAVLVEPGQWVGAGQVLARVDRQVQTQQAASLRSQISVAQADARLAQANLDRAQALVARGFISKAEVDRLVATRDAARARVSVAQAQFGQASASNARLDIRAPAAGLVLERRVDPGQVVSAGSGVLFRMAKGGEMELLAQLGDSDLQRMSTGLRATVVPVGTTQEFTGQIWQIAPVIDPQSRQGIVRIALGYDKALRPGGFAEARITSGAASVPLLPQSAVLSDEKGSYVYVVPPSNKVERRDVQVGDVSDAGVTVIKGLSGQERVVLSAGAFLNPGESVVPQRVKS